MVTIKFRVAPWWMRFHKALELLVFGSVMFDGVIPDIEGVA